MPGFDERPDMSAGDAVHAGLAHEPAITPWAFVVWCPDARVRLANPEFADLAGEPLAALMGRPVTEIAEQYWDDAADAAPALHVLQTTRVETLRVRGELRREDRPRTAVEIWARSIQLANQPWGAAFAAPVSDVAADGDDGDSPVRALDRIVLGLVDQNWTILEVGGDVDEVLGETAPQVVGSPLAEWLRGARLGPDEPSWLDRPRLVQLPHASGGLVPASILWGPPEEGSSSRVFSLNPAPPPAGSARDRAAELEMRLSRIAAEVRAAGLPVGGMAATPDRVAQLASLTDRQWAILSRLMDGMTSSEIASDVFLSPSTVRNHLSAIFRKFGVHNQVQLLRVLGSGE